MKASIVIPNYNSAATVVRSVEAMLRQRVGDGDSFRIVVVDDGSTDGSADRLDERFGNQITLVRLPQNRGRSTGRNAGAAAEDSDVLIFVDSDCVPPDDGFVAAHLNCLRAQPGLSFGAVETPDKDFWSRLQRDAAAWRLRRFNQGNSWTFTTQNVAMSQSLFESAGAFDPAFDHHGFEDRDLFVRLAAAGARVRYTPQARVLHEDRITLANVARKLGEAGYHAAHLFRGKHPDAYLTMAFSRIDCQVRPWLVAVDALGWPLASRIARRPDRWLEWRFLPFWLRALLARTVYGMSFLHGTVLRRRQSARQAIA